MVNFISLTKKDLKDLEKGLNIEVTIDGRPRVYVKHCDCDICKDYSKELHEAYNSSDYVDDNASSCDDKVHSYAICGGF